VTSPDLSRVWGNLRLSLAEKFPKSTMTCLEEHHSIFFWKVKVVIFDCFCGLHRLVFPPLLRWRCFFGWAFFSTQLPELSMPLQHVTALSEPGAQLQVKLSQFFTLNNLWELT
jgi:hypothetical protein